MGKGALTLPERKDDEIIQGFELVHGHSLTALAMYRFAYTELTLCTSRCICMDSETLGEKANHTCREGTLVLLLLQHLCKQTWQEVALLWRRRCRQSGLNGGGGSFLHAAYGILRYCMMDEGKLRRVGESGGGALERVSMPRCYLIDGTFHAWVH